MDIQAYLSHDSIACVRIRGPSGSVDRTPVHFCVLCDVSGSMDMENKISNVKKSLQYITNILTENDYMSVITFAEKAKVLIQRMTVSDANKSIIQQRIESIHAGGGTNLSDSLIVAHDCLTNDLPTHKQGIFLLTDGQANEGITTTEGLMRITEALVRDFAGTTISSIGYGVDHNSELLKAMATENSGSYNLVESNEHVATVFGDILGSLVSCTHKNIIIEMPEGCSQITKYPVEGNKIRIGDLQAEGDISILLGSCAIGKKIKLTGYSIEENAFFSEEVEVKATENNTLLQHGVMTAVRVEVVDIMEKVRRAVIDRTVRLQREALLEEITRKKGAIRLMITVSGSHPVLELLLEELGACETTLNTHLNSERAYTHATQVLTQRSAVVGMGRGVRYEATPGRPEEAPGILSPHATVFSNALQRTISEGMRSATSVRHDENAVPVPLPASPIRITRHWPHNMDPTQSNTPSEVGPCPSDEE